MLILALLLALAAPASAGTVSYTGDCSPRYYCYHYVTYTAAPGERNDVTMARPARRVVEVHDAGAPVRGCTPVDANTARCTLTGMQGGALIGGRSFDVLTATGRVAFEDGAEPEPDRYAGDPAEPASLSYIAAATTASGLDLRRPGTTPEGDFVGNVDSVRGSEGDDVLIGTDGPNTLLGGFGADRIVGLGGDDQRAIAPATCSVAATASDWCPETAARRTMCGSTRPPESSIGGRNGQRLTGHDGRARR